MSPANRPIESTQQTCSPADEEALVSATRDARIRQALKLLRESKTPRLSEVAARVNLSASRFRHLFKKEVGLSPKRYVGLLRLRRAKQLLETSLLEVKEVAALIGVNDVSHFVRSFKATYHHTPSQTRALATNQAGPR